MVLLNLKKQFVVVLISFGIYLSVALFLNYLWDFRNYSLREGQPAFIQKLVYLQIKRSFETTGQVPKIIESERREDYIDYYDPNAWQDSESILFLCQRGRFYTVTFGDGKQATLTYWFVPDDLRRSKDFKFPELKRNPSVFANSARVMVFGAIAVVVATLVSGRLLRR